MRQSRSTDDSKRSIPKNGRKDLVRLSHNIKLKEKQTWFKRVFKAAEKDGINDPNSGTYMARIINMGLPLDQGSLAKVSEFLETHHLRDKDPAST